MKKISKLFCFIICILSISAFTGCSRSIDIEANVEAEICGFDGEYVRPGQSIDHILSKYTRNKSSVYSVLTVSYEYLGHNFTHDLNLKLSELVPHTNRRTLPLKIDIHNGFNGIMVSIYLNGKYKDYFPVDNEFTDKIHQMQKKGEL